MAIKMQTETKIVSFEQFCKLCKYIDIAETEDPCNECLTTPANIDSHKPINFKEKVK